MIETKALGAVGRGRGRWSNFSISGKLMSTMRHAVAPAALDHFRQAMQGLRSEHQIHIGRALRMASPSWLATQPPTPMIQVRVVLAFSFFQRPSW